MKQTKSNIEQVAKKGTPVYSKTGRWIKGWNLNGEYVPNPEFTVENVIKLRLLTLETINMLLKKGFEMDKAQSWCFGDTAQITLKRGSHVKSFKIDKQDYEAIVKHIGKPTFTIK